MLSAGRQNLARSPDPDPESRLNPKGAFARSRVTNITENP